MSTLYNTTKNKLTNYTRPSLTKKNSKVFDLKKQIVDKIVIDILNGKKSTCRKANALPRDLREYIKDRLNYELVVVYNNYQQQDDDDISTHRRNIRNIIYCLIKMKSFKDQSIMIETDDDGNTRKRKFINTLGIAIQLKDMQLLNTLLKAKVDPTNYANGTINSVGFVEGRDAISTISYNTNMMSESQTEQEKSKKMYNAILKKVKTYKVAPFNF